MKAPDKIFASFMNNGSVIAGFSLNPFALSSEYIHKDALLEWANEQIKVAKVNNLAYSPFEKLIDRLNSM